MATSVESGPVIPNSRVPKVDATLKEAVITAGLFPRNGPDPSAKGWGHGAADGTWNAQHKIPKLPLPPLDGSCERYLDALKPLQSQQEHEASHAAVKKFLEGEGPILQAQLQAYDEGVINWFEDFAYQAFLGDQSPVTYNSNAFTSWPPDPNPSRNDQITRAAALIHSTVEFSQAIREDRLPLESIRGVPQCMYQYWSMFGAARVPKDDGGKFRLDTRTRHIVVTCRGQIYRLTVLEEDTGKIIKEEDLAASLKFIVEDASKLSAVDASKSAVGVLTTEHQQTWARLRASLIQKNRGNGQNFEFIDSAIIVLCLDDSAPEGDQAICRNFICGTVTTTSDGVLIGTCLNRWYDKLVLMVCKNGAAGMNFEHTCKDGSVDISMACHIYEGSISPLPYFSQDGPAEGLNANPKKLEWDIPSDVEEGIQDAQKHLLERLNQNQLATLKFRDYGKSFITGSGFSPDAFFQMALHGAYYRLSGKVGNGFEPILTRQYLHGRTDVARTLTPEAANFCRVFHDEKATATEKVEAFRAATVAHSANVKHCAKGLSHHRHLLVLSNLWKRKKAFLLANGLVDASAAVDPSIFMDPGWSVLGTTLVMGSNIENPFMEYAGFGAPGPEAFTAVYYMRKDYMAMCTNSRNGKAQQYADALEATFRDLKTTIEAAAKA